ncbi:MAG: flagellar biosynthetic protein FliO [Burkholderiales bacterium]
MKQRFSGTVLLIGSSCIAPLACAATTTSNTAAASPATSPMMSMMISTLIVIALIVAAAWVLKRLAPRHYAKSDTLRVVAGAAVGQRERVVVVEIGATWLVLGVAPGHVNVLHHLPRAEQPAEPMETTKPRTFAHWLTLVTKKVNENK